MIAKLKRKAVIIGFLCTIAVILIAVFAVPAIAANAPSQKADVNRGITTVQGTIAGINSSSITIKTSGNPSSLVTLGLTDKTNFNIHGNAWLNSASLVGNNVTAVYENNQTVTPPIASQVSINIPALAPIPAPVTPGIKPQVPGPLLPTVRNIATVQGALKVNSEGTIMITPARGDQVGPLKITDNTSVDIYGATLTQSGSKFIASFTLSGNATANYNTDTKIANQVTINVPPPVERSNILTPAPGSGNFSTVRTIAMVQGTIAINPNGTITVTPAKGTAVGPLTLDSTTRIEMHGAALSLNGTKITASITFSGTVSVTYNNQTNVASQITFMAPPVVFPRLLTPNITPQFPGRQTPNSGSEADKNSRT